MKGKIDLISRWDVIEALSKAMPTLNSPDGSHPADHDIQVADEAFVDAMTIIHWLPSAMQDKGHIRQKPEGLEDILGEEIGTELYVDGFNDGYKAGWEDGRDALREEIWENDRDRLD